MGPSTRGAHAQQHEQAAGHVLAEEVARLAAADDDGRGALAAFMWMPAR